jgi:zinc transport system permease protein
MVARSYKQTFIISIVLGFIYMMIGIILSYYYDVKPGGAIVICAVVGMAIMSIYGKVRKMGLVDGS